MELNINSPAYFSDHYGIDDDVYRYCQKLYTFFKDKQYSNSLSIIGNHASGCTKRTLRSRTVERIC